MVEPTDPPVLDPSSSEARRLLADELAKPEYSTEESPLRRAVQVVVDWFTGVFDQAAGGPLSIWWYAVVGAGALALVGLVGWALLRLEPARRARAGAPGGVFDEAGVTAAEYRRRAELARSAGDHAGAVVDGYRAIVAEAVERFVIDDLPGSTAREIAGSLAAAFPGETARTERAATVFDAVRYGGRGADAGTADAVLDLDRRLRSLAPTVRSVP